MIDIDLETIEKYLSHWWNRERAKRYVALQAISGNGKGTGRYFVAAPIPEQAKRIFGDDIKKLIPRQLMSSEPSESRSRLIVSLLNGSEIHVVGMTRYILEGISWDGGVLDEYADMNQETLPMYVRPSLSEKKGWCLFTISESTRLIMLRRIFG